MRIKMYIYTLSRLVSASEHMLKQHRVSYRVISTTHQATGDVAQFVDKDGEQLNEGCLHRSPNAIRTTA